MPRNKKVPAKPKIKRGEMTGMFRSVNPKLVAVEMLASDSGYSKGEIVGVTTEMADALVKKKLAKLYKAEKTKPEPEDTVTK